MLIMYCKFVSYYSPEERKILEESGIPYFLEKNWWEGFRFRMMFISPELSAIGVRSGGLADVATNLSVALAELGVEVDVVVPYHQAAKKIFLASPGRGEDSSKYLETYLYENSVWQRTLFAQQGIKPMVMRSTLMENLNYTLLGSTHDEYFGGNSSLYVGANPEKGPGDAERFLYFCMQAAAYINMREKNGYPAELVHVNDWSSGLVSFYEKMLSGNANTPTIGSVHNIYSARLPMDLFNALSGDVGSNQDLNCVFSALHRGGAQIGENIDFLAALMKWSDHLLTVSDQYRNELLQDNKFSGDYTGIFRLINNEHIFDGIVNGFNPNFELNEVLKDLNDWPGEPVNNTYALLKARAFMKEKMQKELGLDVNPNAMVMGFINRWTDQKSYKETIEVMRRLMTSDPNIQFAVTGLDLKNQPEESRLFLELKQKFPGRVTVKPYSDALARKLMPALDLHLMPSKYEPCGISQLNAYAVGTPTLANCVGGLKQTIINGKTGFTFDSISEDGNSLSDSDFVEEFYKTVLTARNIYKNNPEQWNKLVTDAYEERHNYSWTAVAEKYLYYYGKVIANRMKLAYIYSNGQPREGVFRPAWLMERSN